MKAGLHYPDQGEPEEVVFLDPEDMLVLRALTCVVEPDKPHRRTSRKEQVKAMNTGLSIARIRKFMPPGTVLEEVDVQDGL